MSQIATLFTFTLVQRVPISLLEDIGTVGDPQDVSWSHPPYETVVQLEFNFR